jgi:hypothetical protein
VVEGGKQSAPRPTRPAAVAVAAGAEGITPPVGRQLGPGRPPLKGREGTAVRPGAAGGRAGHDIRASGEGRPGTTGGSRRPAPQPGTSAAETAAARRILVVGESETFEYSMRLAQRHPTWRIIATRLDPVEATMADAPPNLAIRGEVDATRLADAFRDQTFDDLVFNAPRSVDPAHWSRETGDLIDAVLGSGRDVLSTGGTVRFSGGGNMPGQRRLDGHARGGTERYPIPAGYGQPPIRRRFLDDPHFGVRYTPRDNAGEALNVSLEDIYWYLFSVE